MSLSDNVQSDAAIFTRPADFGEARQYRPAGQAAKTINMIVTHHPLKAQQHERSISRPIEILVDRNDVPEVDLNAPDMVEVPRYEGGDPEWQPVTAILAGDEGMWRLAVGR